VKDHQPGRNAGLFRCIARTTEYLRESAACVSIFGRGRDADANTLKRPASPLWGGFLRERRAEMTDERRDWFVDLCAETEAFNATIQAKIDEFKGDKTAYLKWLEDEVAKAKAKNATATGGEDADRVKDQREPEE